MVRPRPLVLELQSPQASYKPSAEAVSRPLYEPVAGNALAWEAGCLPAPPSGCVASARRGGAPGSGQFVGPDGTAATAFAAPARCRRSIPVARRRYAVALQSGPGRRRCCDV